MEGSDLAANPDFIMAGGTMSILRRKGKQHKKDRAQAAMNIKGFALYNEMLSGDIMTLMKTFHEEAQQANVSITATKNDLISMNFCRKHATDQPIN